MRKLLTLLSAVFLASVPARAGERAKVELSTFDELVQTADYIAVVSCDPKKKAIVSLEVLRNTNGWKEEEIRKLHEKSLFNPLMEASPRQTKALLMSKNGFFHFAVYWIYDEAITEMDEPRPIKMADVREIVTMFNPKVPAPALVKEPEPH